MVKRRQDRQPPAGPFYCHACGRYRGPAGFSRWGGGRYTVPICKVCDETAAARRKAWKETA